ncbi:kinetochore Sim4 complex subunit FTA2-domain-containing protein [Nemania abortiva]|nr:kinetochore Sim4 complex subunit FTA2-domain-containing protein [Nemania abortiva]
MAGLPDIPGPKLYPFNTSGRPLEIDFLEQIGKGAHSFVWKVKINEKIYALKIFLAYFLPPNTYGADLSEEDEYVHSQPFHNECRAYGRLKEFGREDLAVACHGYIILDEKHTGILKKAYTDTEWYSDWGVGRTLKHGLYKPLQALVKDLIHIPTDLRWVDEFKLIMNPRIARKAIKDLKTIHRLGVCVGDISTNNFIYGKHIEFSYAWTAPHPLLTRQFGDDFGGLRRHFKDTEAMDELIDDWNRMHPNRKIWVRCEPSEEYRDKLRKRRRAEDWWDWDVNPADFDYEKAQKRFGRLKAVEAPQSELSEEKNEDSKASTI